MSSGPMLQTIHEILIEIKEILGILMNNVPFLFYLSGAIVLFSGVFSIFINTIENGNIIVINNMSDINYIIEKMCIIFSGFSMLLIAFFLRKYPVRAAIIGVLILIIPLYFLFPELYELNNEFGKNYRFGNNYLSDFYIISIIASITFCFFGIPATLYHCYKSLNSPVT